MPTKYVDYLIEDEPIPGQNWVCISFLAPEIEKIKNCSLRGIKIRGIFNKREDADTHAEKLRKKDPDFDIFVGEVGKWLPWDPDPDQVEDEKWQEKELNHIASKYKKAREQSKVVFEERKDEMMKKTAVEEDQKLIKIRDRLKKKLEKQKNKNDNNTELNDNNTENKLLNNDKIDEMMKKIKDKEEELKINRDNLLKKNIHINDEEKELNNINKELKKAEKLYQSTIASSK